MKRCNLVVLIVATLHLSSAAPAAELGRLFLTPVERSALDESRYAERQQVDMHVEIEAPDAMVVAEDEIEVLAPIVVNGFVSRSDGADTIWINGMDTRFGDLSELGITNHGVQVEAARVRVMRVQDQPPLMLKPGQSFDPGSEQVTDVYDKPQAAPPP